MNKDQFKSNFPKKKSIYLNQIYLFFFYKNHVFFATLIIYKNNI